MPITHRLIEVDDQLGGDGLAALEARCLVDEVEQTLLEQPALLLSIGRLAPRCRARSEADASLLELPLDPGQREAETAAVARQLAPVDRITGDDGEDLPTRGQQGDACNSKQARTQREGS